MPSQTLASPSARIFWSFVQSQGCEFPLASGSPVTGSFPCGYRGFLLICRVTDVASEMCVFSDYFGQSWGIPGLFRRSPGAAVESALPQQLLSSSARAVCNPNVLSEPGWGWMNKSNLTFDPGDFGIPQQSDVKTAIVAVKGKGQGLNHYPGFCAQEMARGEAQADGRITFPLSRAVNSANSCLG